METYRLRTLPLLVAAAALGGCSLNALSLPDDAPAPEEIETTLFLVGDAGEPDPREVGAPLDSIHAQAALAPQRSVILFLGDNVYPTGIPDEGRAEWADARRRLAAQVTAVPMGARGIFIPGNHDWGYPDEAPFGLYALRLQEAMIDELAGGRDVRLLPSNGCPGPVTMDVGRTRLVLLDTQWWLHEYIVRDEQSDCAANAYGEVTARLRAAVADTTPGRITFVAAHHPLMSGGPHGGYCGITGPFHRFGGRAQDIMSGRNQMMRDSIEAAMSINPPLAFVAGHEHNQQVLHGGESTQYVLVSGAGSYSKAECAVRMRESYYVSQNRSGFMRIDILRGQGVHLQVYRFSRDGSGGLSYSRWLEPRA